MMLPAGARGETLARPGGRLDGRSVFRGAFRPARFAMLPGIVAEAIRGRYTGGEAGTASVAERAAVGALTAGVVVCNACTLVGEAGEWRRWALGPGRLCVSVRWYSRGAPAPRRARRRPAARALRCGSGQVVRGPRSAPCSRLMGSSPPSPPSERRPKLEPARMSARYRHGNKKSCVFTTALLRVNDDGTVDGDPLPHPPPLSTGTLSQRRRQRDHRLPPHRLRLRPCPLLPSSSQQASLSRHLAPPSSS